MSFSIFGVEIFVYGIIVASSMLAAFIVGLVIFKLIGYKEEIAYLILALVIPLGIIIARLYYVAFSPHNFSRFFDIINIRGGGMAIYGGIIGGALGLFIASRIKKVGFYTLADIAVIGLILAQAIGRWGNFVNEEIYGFGVSNHVPPFTVNIGGSYHLSTGFIESMLNLIGFGLMVWLFFYLRKRGTYKWGITSGFYLIWYGTVRAILEPLRDPNYILRIFPNGPNIVFNQVSFMLSIALVILGVLLLVAVRLGYVSQENNACLKTKTDT